MTAGLQCPAEFIPAPGTLMCPADDSQFPWMSVAMGELGVREVVGSRHNPRILEYFTAVRGHIRDDETAWCSAFANWVIRETGLEGTRRGNARSWATWGTQLPLEALPYGAIAVLWRGSPSSWKGHVAFYAGTEGGDLVLLGGNQGNAVCLKKYPRNRLLALCWPPGFPAPNQSYAA